jgi:hypothetical protein
MLKIQDGGKTPNLKKDLARIFSKARPDVTIQDGGETPILKKDLARIFSSQL